MAYKASGAVDDLGAGVERKIIVVREDTGELLGVTQSDVSSGEYELIHNYSGKALAICEGEDSDGQRWRVHGPFSSILFAESYSEIVLDDGPLGYWPMGDNGAVQDMSGNGKDATVFGDTDFLQPEIESLGSGSMGFDGSGDYWTIDDADITNLSALTIEGWFIARSLRSPRMKVVTRGLDVGSDRSKYAFEVNINDDGTIRLDIASGSSNQIINHSEKIVIDTPYHFVGTYDGANLAFSLNSDYETAVSSIGSPNTISGPLQVGRENDAGSGGDYFDGFISDIAIYNYALTEQQIQDHYDSGTGAV